MKTTYNGTYTEVNELQHQEGVVELKQHLKEYVLQDSFFRANFLSGARFLKTLKDSNILTIDEVIESNDEVSIVCKNQGFQQLGVFLENSVQMKDSFLVELISKMLNCLDSLHKNSIYHQGLNPNSFVVDSHGDVKLTLFGTLEHRLYHHFPVIGNENPSIQNAIRFYSPERKENYGVVNQSSEYYSFGLIIWYLLCVQRNLSSHRDLVLSFPDFSFTGSIWDKVLEACLNEDPKKRPKSVKEILDLLPFFAKESIKNEPIEIIDEFAKDDDRLNEIIIYNYNESLYNIQIDDKPLEKFKFNIIGNELKILVDLDSTIKIYLSSEKNKLFVKFNTPESRKYYLPEGIDVKNVKQSNYSLKFLGLGLVSLVIICLMIVYYINSSGSVSHNGLRQNPPIGMELNDTMFSDVLLEKGYQMNNTFYRYNNNQLEFSEDTTKTKKWIRYNSENKQDLLNLFFVLKPVDGYPYSNVKIENRIREYYKLIDAGSPLDSLSNFFEPVLDVYFNNKNVQNTYVTNEIKNVLAYNKTQHEILKKSLKINRFRDSVQVFFTFNYFKTSKYYGITEKKNNITSQITFSKKLKIATLTNINK